jgi:hypothetical protein
MVNLPDQHHGKDKFHHGKGWNSVHTNRGVCAPEKSHQANRQRLRYWHGCWQGEMPPCSGKQSDAAIFWAFLQPSAKT